MEDKHFVVGIGASAGGLDAISQLFDNMPNDTGFVFVIVQHLSPDYKSLMPELLAKHTRMKIYTAEDNQTVESNCIYLNPKSNNLLIRGDKLFLADKSLRPNLNLPIDIFFHTLGEEHKDRAIGVILSGTGSDGSRGIRTIKEAGGTVYVQEPESAQFDGMPNSSINTNLVDYILTPDQIAKVLVKTEMNRIKLSSEDDELFKSNEIAFYKIIDEIHRSYGIDFKRYKRNTLLRRLEKRMNINNLERLYDYYDYAVKHDLELEKLKQDFLVGVTSFFRDSEVFDLIKKDIIPAICRKKLRDKEEEIRVWVAGCSTGEEVFSLAMLLDDHIKTKKLKLGFKIFATDVDEIALEKASSAIFSANSVKDIPDEYVDTYFVKLSNEQFSVTKYLREKVVFSQHNLLKDPPFIRMDLISCRNMLIYFENAAQKKVLMNFQFSLNVKGYMILGTSESLGSQSDHFKTIDSKWKIYQNTFETKRLPMQDMDTNYSPYLRNRDARALLPNNVALQHGENSEHTFYKYISQEFGPVLVFIDSQFNILFINGDISGRLFIKSGVFENNLLKMLNTSMVPAVRSGIRTVIKEGKEVVIKDVRNMIGDHEYCFDLSFRKLSGNDSMQFGGKGMEPVFIICFSEDREIDEQTAVVLEHAGTDALSKQHIEMMEAELNKTRIELKTVVEELETSNEELQASNEELMASNEELQSTNEELQSVNEELYTVNAELQEKNKELSLLNNDVNNLLNSTDIGTLFLDVDLRIRKFTPALTKHFNLQEGDLGRSISSFASTFREEDRKSIVTDCKSSLEKLTAVESEVWDEAGSCYLRKISPFITSEKKIEGVVVSFVDISNNKRAEEQISRSEKKYRELFDNQLSLIAVYQVIYDQDGKAVDLAYVDCNDKFAEFLELPKSELMAKNVTELRPNFMEEQKELFESYVRVVETGQSERFENYFDCLDLWSDVKVFSYEKGFGVTIADDITQRKKAEERLRKNEFKLIEEKRFAESILATSPNGIYIYNFVKERHSFINQQYTKMLGYRLDELRAMPKEELIKLYHPDDFARISEHMKNMPEDPAERNLEVRFRHKEGHWVWCYSVYSPFVQDKDGQVISVIGSVIDLSRIKRAEMELKEAKHKAEIANIYKNQFLANMSHEIRTPINGIVGFAHLLKQENLSQEEKENYVKIVKNSSNQLLMLIDDIIDISKIESGELKLSRKPYCLPEMFTSLQLSYEELKKQNKKEQVELVVRIPEGQEDLIINTDPLRLKQVMSNLLDNALKFSEQGRIEFGYELGDETIRFFVTDQGIGISEENLGMIFERFEQVYNINHGKNDGTGLGLAISRGIVGLLGGRMSVESEEGKGSTFAFELPLKEPEEETISDCGVSWSVGVEDHSIGELKILIAEDEYINQEYFKCLLKEYPFTCLYARNGEDAVETYFEEPDIDVVLMDIKMPVMDGEEAAEQILARDPEAKIIAQTAYAMGNDREKYSQKGFKGYITKPINVDELLTVLKKVTA